MQKFSFKHFRSPRAVCTPGYFWIMNAPMEKEILISQLEDFRSHGARSVCLHPCPRNWAKNSTMSPDYMTEEYMAVIRLIVEECKRLDMCFYLYDEGGFPSGSAAGQVFLSNPHDFAQQGIKLSASGKDVIFTRDDTVSPCAYPNLLTPGVTEKFIELTHEKFRKAVGDYFGKNIFYTFTDEPRLPRFMMDHELSWCDDFPDVFKRRKGYRIEPFLKDILEGKNTHDSERLKHRVDYFDVCSQLLIERFFLPVRKWSRDNGLMSGGHMAGENSTDGNYYFAYGHILRTLRAMDFPGVDVIWRQIYPKTHPATPNRKAVPRKFDPISTGAKSHPFTKYASSIAHQAGRSDVLSETFAVYGAGLTPDIMRFLTDYQLVRGATRFVLSNVPMVIKGAGMIDCRPFFGQSNPLWPYFDLYHSYTARMCELMSAGIPDIHVAFHHDIRSIWCGGDIMKEAVRQHNTTAEALLARQCDFDFIDDDVLRKARLIGNKLHIGKMAYDTIVIPHSDWITPASRKKLDALRQAGGHVCFPEEISQIPPVLKITPSCPDIRITKRLINRDSILYFITNESPDSKTFEITIPESGSLMKMDAETGRTVELKRNSNGTLSWTFPPYQSLALMVNANKQADTCLHAFEPGAVQLLKDGWTLQAVSRYYVGESTFQQEHTPGERIPAALGDWRQYLGQEFSGEAIYRTDFQTLANKSSRLSLGNVQYACSVYLNGTCIGRRFWGPYTFDIAPRLLKRRNTLEIRVTNTFANAVCSKSANEIWEKLYSEDLKNAHYESVLRFFEPDSFPSGLIGPVKLTYSK